jgi:hypothetical protein
LPTTSALIADSSYQGAAQKPKTKNKNKNKAGDPRGPSRVCAPEAKKTTSFRYKHKPGPDLCFRYFFVVFVNSPHREAPKNVIKDKSKTERKSIWIFGRFFSQNVFCSAFEVPSLKNT